MEDQQPAYSHSPLDTAERQIRLFHLLPSALEDDEDGNLYQYEACNLNNPNDIFGYFSLASLDQHPRFHALSYVWGDPATVATIKLDGYSFPVTSNLYTALSCMRQETEEFVLWIDALCINQFDLDERAAQIALMERIYTQARTVLVFLGDEWEGAYMTMGLIKLVATRDTLHFDRQPCLDEKTVETMRGIKLESNDWKDNLLKFLHLPWWTRLWTVQEVVLAQNVWFVCGRRYLDGNVVREFVLRSLTHGICCPSFYNYAGAEENGKSIGAGLERAQPLVDASGAEIRQNHGFMLVAAAFRSRKCLHAKDKVYGLLGLAAESFRRRIAVDYNFSPQEVYTSVVIATIAESRNLDYLSIIHGMRRGSLALPSFIPDFTAPVDQEWEPSYLGRGKIVSQQFYASLDSLANLSMISADEATTPAMHFDSILETGHALNQPTWSDHISELRHLLEISTMPTSKKPDALWRRLCGGGIYGTLSADESAETWREYYYLWQDWFANSDADSIHDMRNDMRVLEFHRAVISATAGRKFMVTNNGHMGLVPVDSESGDAVVLMPGGKVPYVLRQLSSPAKEEDDEGGPSPRVPAGCAYEVLGDAYVYGVMHGEIWDERKLRTVILR